MSLTEFLDVGENSVLLFSALCIVIISVLIVPLLIFITSVPFAEIIRHEQEEYYMDENQRLMKFPSIEDDWKIHLSVVVPAYNEEKRLPPMLDECLSFLNQRQKDNAEFNYEVIIVNDGSTDSTASVAAEYTKSQGSEKVRVLNLVKNRGKGGAVRLGVLSARGAVILFADADGATKFSDIVKLEEELENVVSSSYLKSPEQVDQKLAIVCGSRAHLEQEAVASRSFFRTILMYGFHFLVWMFTVRTIKDTQCGFKLFTREAATQCFYNQHVERWAFDVEILYIANRFHIPISEIAVNWVEIEGSKIVPIFSWIQMAFDLFMIWFRYFIGAWDITLVTKK
ncbi:dolichyl-phosphate beta-glucosyltransferase [Planococcus citri]|uniref:dolichyl-phosphate beta-glucosyltransferase n=1 Tax=Planococcus citri TaxID=170843 RepID=UPI0031F7378E